MGKLRKCCVLKVVLILLVAGPHKTVTVSPALCPTNKIAPHRVVASGRTFAAYYDLLLGPNKPYTGPHTQHPGPHNQHTGPHTQHTGPQSQHTGPHTQQFGPHTQQPGHHTQQTGLYPQYDPVPNSQSSLQEVPQPDQADDCGDIEDYDENDLSFVNQRKQRRIEHPDNRFFFGGLFQKPQPLPPYKPPQTTSPAAIHTPPTRPPTPGYLPHRPPYWSGGVFGNNQYKPPLSYEPSDNLKPVHEAAVFSEVQQTYRPGVVGGPLNHVVGHTQAARPTASTNPNQTTRRRTDQLLFPNRIQPTQPAPYTTRRPRPRKLTNDGSVIGSFLDLFF